MKKMAVFQPEKIEYFNPDTAHTLDRNFKQTPEMLPFTIDLSHIQTPYPIQPSINNNTLAVLGIIGVLSFFGLIAFLAYMGRR